MENNVKESLTHRILAGALAFLMVFSMLPFGVIDVFAESGQYTVEVRDNDTDEIISEASVTIFDSSSGEVSSPYELDTDETYTYSASAEGYETGSGGVEFPAEGNVITIKLTKSAPVNPTYTVTITVTDGENALDGTTVTLGEDSTTTDGDGKAEFSGISAGSYIISAAKSGYKGGSLEITVVDTDVSEELELTTKAEGEIIFDPADGAELVYGNSVTVSSEDYADSELNIYGTGFDVDALTVTMNTVGDVTVNVTASENDDYLGTSASASYTVAKAPLAWSVAEIPTNLIYTDTFTNRVAGVPENKVTYSGETDGISVDAATGEVTATKPGSITVTATVEENDYYEGGEISYTVTFAAAQSVGYVLSFADGEAEIAANTADYVRAATLTHESETVENATINYTSSDITVAEVSDAGALTIHKAGTVTITAIWQEDDNHAPISASYNLAITAAAHTVSFGETKNAEITFNDYNNEYTVSAVSSAELPVSYSVVSGNATITGNVLTITGAGVIEVSATAGSDVYATSTDTFALNVKRYAQTIEFAESDYSVALGATFNSPTASVSSAFSNDNAIVYSVESDDNGIIESFNSETGAYTLKLYTTGTVTIKAVKAGDSNYTDAVASYSITVTAASAEGKYYFNGEAVKEWYKTGVELTAADNCTILDPAENKALEKTTFEDEGLHTVSFRVQTTEGISEVITKTFSIDKTDPAVSISTGEISVWDKVLSFFTGNENKLFEVTFSDNSSGSGIDKVYYTVENTTDIKTKDEIEAITEWTEYDPAEKISVGVNKVFIIYVKVVDKAENANYARTNGVIFENIKPTIDIACSDNSIEGDPVFNTDIPMTVTVVDGGDEVYSGLKSVNYTINLGGKVLKTESIVVDGAEDPARADLLKDHSFEVKIPASYVENEETYYINSDAVVLTVTATDRSGNSLTTSRTFKISTAKPVIEVEWQNDPQIIATESGINYYNAARTAKITISGNAFALGEPGNGTVAITEHGGDHTDTHNTYSISQWTPAEDGKSYSATVSFAGSAVYDSFTVSYSDDVNAAESVSFTNFAVDLDTPTGSVTISNKDTWTTLVNTLTFKLFGNTDVTVSVVGNDNTSPWTVKYYKTDAKTAIDPSALPDEEWQESAPPIGANETVTVYVKITDIVGHPAFISTDGYIADNTDGVINTVYPQANNNGFHNANVPITVTPNDMDENGNYSGIKSLEYWIAKDGSEGEHTNLYTYVPENSYFTELQSSVERSFTVVAADNNSNNVTVHIKAVDNSDNEFTEEIPLKIDVTAPTSKLSFATTGEDESLNAPKVVENLHYFDQKLIATLVYTERNFSKEEAVEGIVISKNNNTLSTEEKNAIISWTDAAGATPDEATHTATIDFTENAHYTLAVTYTDLAGNSMVNVDVTDQSCYSPWEFTVDTVPPSAKVKLDGTTKWTELLESLSFGIWKNETITISIEAEESVSPRYPVQYYIYEYAAADSANLTKTDLDNLAEEDWTEGTSVNLNASARSVVYFKIKDYSGNQNYFSTDGIIVETIKSGITVEYPATVKNENIDTGYYTGDVIVHINVTDDYPYSGISKIEWWTTTKDTDESDERIGQSTATLYEFQHGDSVQFSELLNAWEGDVTVSAETNSSDYVKVHVKVTDNAGNVKETDEPYIKIDANDPQISVRFDDSVPVKTDNGRGYFGAERKAWITVTERTSVFDGERVKSGIVIDAENAAGVKLDDLRAAIIGGTWTTSESNESADLDTHTLELTFSEDANYDFSVSYTNKLNKTCYYEAPDGIENPSVVSFEGDPSEKKLFTVDKAKPTGDVKMNGSSKWDDLISTLSFGIWENTSVSITFEADDETSPLHPILMKYYENADLNTTGLSEDDLEEIQNWDAYEEKTVNPDTKFVIYYKVTDYAGNTKYFSTDGIITESTQSGITVTYSDTKVNDYYTDDFDVSINVKDINESGSNAYSGIKHIEWWTTHAETDGGEAVESEHVTLYDFDYTEQTSDGRIGNLKVYDASKAEGEKETEETFDNGLPYAKLLTEWSGTFTVSAKDNSSDCTIVHVKVTDNSGNTFETSEQPLKIDANDPQISVKFDNSKPNKTVDGRGYFGAERKAWITVTERTSVFDGDLFKSGIVIGATKRNGDPLSLRDGIISGEWVTVKSTEHCDKDTHTLELTFSEDANYDFSVSYTNKLNKTCYYTVPGDNPNATVVTFEEIEVEDQMEENPPARQFFTIDKTNPIDLKLYYYEEPWETLFDTLTFNLDRIKHENIEIKGTANDVTSPYVYYIYKTSDKTALDKEALDKLFTDGKFELIGNVSDAEISTSIATGETEAATIYMRVEDFAGKYEYISTKGLIVDKKHSAIEFAPLPTASGQHNGVYVFNKNQTVTFSVSDDYVVENESMDAGIYSVDYWIVNYATLERFTNIKSEYAGMFDTLNGSYQYPAETEANDQIFDENGVPKLEEGDKLTKSDNIFKFNQDGEFEYTKEMPLHELKDQTIEIDARANNSCYVVLFVQVTDNAGNVYTKTAKFDFDVDSPSVSIAFDNNSPRNGKYYNRVRTASISYGDSRNGHLSGMSPSTTGKINGSSVVFDTDGEHSLSASVSDIAGNSASTSTETFIIDLTKPTAKVTVGSLGSWEGLLETLTFGLWSRDKVTITAEYADATSPIESVSYYKTASAEIMTEEELGALAENAWVEYNAFETDADEQFVVYLRVTDYAGNITYVSTDGIIMDANAPVEESISPEITIDPVQPVNEIYNGDVKVAISVVDPTNGETFSGLKEVSYRVLNLGEVTQSGVLYAFDLTSPTRGELLERWTGEITVDSALNNSNDVVIEVSAVDNAGNTSTDSTAIKIDITNPRIDVSYNLNNPDSGSYYRDIRTATIRVTERNFDPNAVRLTVTNTGGVIPALSAWTEQPGGGNGDNTVHTATLSFANDGVYTFSVTTADLASNPSGEPNYAAGTANANGFTIDRTQPAVSVSFDNNDVRSDTFFKAARTATVTVIERNFNVDRVRFTMTASLDGAAIAVPEPVWTNNGDTHVATIAFEADGDYTFDVTATDMAGNIINGVNYGESAAYAAFTVDKTPPTLAISGILDESANNSAGNIGFVFTATDINFDALEPTFNAVFFENGDFVTEALSFGETVEIDHGKQFIVENLERDGIYRITCVAVDKAGNGYVEVVIDNSDGSTSSLERKEGDNLLTFSVNRDGSTFEIDEYTTGVLHNYYVQNVTSDVTITEINADPLKSFSVSVNNKELTEGVDYTVTESGENWKKYVYSINKSVFEAEGEYNVVIASMDKADNTAYSDVKNAGIDFVVDRTPPVVTVSGMQTDGRYQVEKQTVTIIPTDDGGALNNLTVRLVDRNGETIREIYNLSGEELEEAIAANGGALTFDIEEGLFQNVEVICTDLAAGEDVNVTNTYDVTFENVSVSTSALAIFWANRPLRWGVIGGGAGVIATGTGTVVFFRKRKKIN